MPTLTIRNVPAKMVRALKARAKRHGNSMEQELREMIESAVVDRATLMAQLERLRSNQTRPTTAEEINEWIRESRR